jgi:TPR repeat protein
MKETMKAFAQSYGFLLGAIFYISFVLGILWFFFSALRIVAAIVNVSTGIGTILIIPIFLIALIFKRSRSFCGRFTLIFSYMLGASSWLTATVNLHELWGKAAVGIGVLFLGVGPIPLGCIALLVHHQFATTFEIIAQLVVAFILRAVGLWIDSAKQRSDLREREYAPQDAEGQYEYALNLLDQVGKFTGSVEDLPPEEQSAITSRSQNTIRVAVGWLRRSAQQDYGEAQVFLGKVLSSGGDYNFLLDEKEASVWFLKAAELGIPKAQSAIGKRYRSGRGVTRNYAAAIIWLLKAAVQDDADAQSTLGMMYFSGDGVTDGYKQSFEWTLKAAEQGHREAQNNLGVLYQNGYGVRKNYRKAIEWFTKAAEQGVVLAQREVGLYHAWGRSRGVAKDHEKAAEWFQLAAEKNDAVAQFQLALLYMYGKGVGKNGSVAVSYALRSADQGNTEAQCLLGEAYFFGKGVAVDRHQASIWFRKAADQGNSRAKNKLAEFAEAFAPDDH